MAGTKMGYSSICLISKLKVSRARCSLCVKDGMPQIAHTAPPSTTPPSAEHNWEQLQLKSDASVYSRCLEPLFALPTLNALII